MEAGNPLLRSGLPEDTPPSSALKGSTLPWGTELCKGPLLPFQVQGQEGWRGDAFSHPLIRFLLFLSQKLSRISSLGLDVEDRLLLPSSGLKYKELQTLPPVLDELERNTIGRTKLASQSCPAALAWRP